MIKIGITGGIGSGKSTVSKVFELLGVPVYYSDTVAKELMNDNSIQKKITDLFGKHVLLNTGLVDRKAIAAIVFKDKDKLQQLNKIIHPAVGEHFNNWVSQQKEATYILKEAAILFESGANKFVDKVIVVTAPKDLRIERVLYRDKSNREEIEQRIKNQMDDKELVKLADYVIINDETQSVIQQVLSIHKEINQL